MGTLRRINVKHETSVKKRTILTTCKVWSLCQNNRRKRGLCTMRTNMSSKSEINTDSVSVTECFFLHFGDAMANSLRHFIINCYSNTLQILVTAGRQPVTVA